jgi:hypothetical protein
MKFRVKESQFGAPVGVYLSKFIGTKMADKPTEFGQGRVWEFEITTGPFKGRIVSRVTDTEPTIKNSCGKMILSLVGELPADREIDVAPCVGRAYQVVIEPSRSGKGTRVGSVLPPPADGVV